MLKLAGMRSLRMYGTRNLGCRGTPNSEHRKLGTRNSWVGESGTRDVWNADGLGLRMYGTQNSDCMELRSLELRMYGNQNSECVGLKKFELKCIVSKGRNSECICLRYWVARMRPMCCVAWKRQKYSVVGLWCRTTSMWLMYVVNACDQETAANVCDRKGD